MQWWEFKEDNGDGSWGTRRFKTKEEAEEAMEWCENNIRWFLSDGNGVCCVDTESRWFWDSLEDIKADYS